jgi:hypothetical protein
MLQLDEKTISTADDFILGNDKFKIIESPGKIVFYDAERDQGFSVTGDIDNDAIKKDILEYFNEQYEREGALDLRIEDISNHIWLNKSDNVGDEYYGIYRIEGAYLNIPGNQEDVWIKSYDEKYASGLDETLTHTFGDTAVKFGIKYPLSDPPSKINPDTAIVFGRLDGSKLTINIKGDIDTAKALIDNTIKHFDKEQNMSLLDINNYLKSQREDTWIKAEINNPQGLTTQLAKKAGYVQGVCECVAAIGDDHTLGKKLLSEMNVTKDTAKKFANPETYKALEQGIFAPQQKLEQTHNIKR